MRKGGKDIILNVKHQTLFVEENDPETGQFNIARMSDATLIEEVGGGKATWKDLKERLMKDDYIEAN